MHKHLSALVSVLLICCFALSAFAWGAPTAANDNAVNQGLMFSAVCASLDEVKAAVEAGADFVSPNSEIDLTEVYSAVGADAAVIIDADSVEQADEKYNEILTLNKIGNTYFRIRKASPKALEKWSEGKEIKPRIIVYYKGNVYFSAVDRIKKCGNGFDSNIVQLQTGNPYGVVLHSTVTGFLNKNTFKVRGMFSTADSTMSAERTDTVQGWDDLISRGYQIIETAYPADFSEYLEENRAEFSKLEESISQAKEADTKGCPSNRVNDYNKALSSAQALIDNGFASKTDSAAARVKLDLAVKNIAVRDGKQIKGDFAVTPGRIIAAVLGIAFVVAMQLWFRSRWGKQDSKSSTKSKKKAKK